MIRDQSIMLLCYVACNAHKFHAPIYVQYYADVKDLCLKNLTV